MDAMLQSMGNALMPMMTKGDPALEKLWTEYLELSKDHDNPNYFRDVNNKYREFNLASNGPSGGIYGSMLGLIDQLTETLDQPNSTGVLQPEEFSLENLRKMSESQTLPESEVKRIQQLCWDAASKGNNTVSFELLNTNLELVKKAFPTFDIVNDNNSYTVNW